MKNTKIKQLQEFQSSEIKTTEIYGGWKDVIQTGSGTVQGMSYTSDFHFDNDSNGEWGQGESVIFNWDAQINKA